MKLGELVDRVEARLRAARLHYGHGTDNPRDEAAFLVLRALGLPFDAQASRPVRESGRRRIESLVRKRTVQRIPAAYLLREAWLDGIPFYVDERVIIPRSHIAELLARQLKPWLARPPRRVLDLCTGSGCLAVLAATAFPRARVDAVDISGPALAVAGRNVRRYRMTGRIRLVRSDLFTALGGETYSLIVANPPYVRTASMRRLPPEYRREPALALAGDDDGLLIVNRILSEARTHLTAGGLLVCEIGANRAALERAWPRLPFLWPETAAGIGRVFALPASDLPSGGSAAGVASGGKSRRRSPVKKMG